MGKGRKAALESLLAKEEIRELAQLYSRGVDRKDYALLRSLYASDGVDNHGDYFRGSAKDYVDWLETRLPHLRYSGHQVCNHLISLSGDDGEGEVYAIAWHAAPAANGAFVEDIQLVRYLDRYRKEDGRWRFASRDVAFDFHAQHPIRDLDWAAPAREGDLSQLHRPTSSTGSLSNV